MSQQVALRCGPHSIVSARSLAGSTVSRIHCRGEWYRRQVPPQRAERTDLPARRVISNRSVFEKACPAEIFDVGGEHFDLNAKLHFGY